MLGLYFYPIHTSHKFLYFSHHLLLRGRKEHAHQQEQKVDRWEYKLLEKPRPRHADEVARMNRILNQCGDDRWEIVSVTYRSAGDMYIFIMKRVKRKKSA